MDVPRVRQSLESWDAFDRIKYTDSDVLSVKEVGTIEVLNFSFLIEIGRSTIATLANEQK